jgi:hypothetical protein
MSQEEFYKDICEASTREEEAKVCIAYHKPYRKVRTCIEDAIKEHGLSFQNDKVSFHKMIIKNLKNERL